MIVFAVFPILSLHCAAGLTAIDCRHNKYVTFSCNWLQRDLGAGRGRLHPQSGSPHKGHHGKSLCAPWSTVWSSMASPSRLQRPDPAYNAAKKPRGRRHSR